MNIIANLVLRFFSFLWRQHERRVLVPEFVVRCDGGEGSINYGNEETVITMDPKQITTTIEMLVDEEAHQGYAAAASSHEPAMDPSLVEELETVAEAFRRKRQEEFSVIVITRLAPVDGGLKCFHDSKWHLLINALTWVKLSGQIPQLQLAAPFRLLGIPVVEDDELAMQAMISAVASNGGDVRFDE